MSSKPRAIVSGCLGVVALLLAVAAPAAEREPRFTRSQVAVKIPKVTLINQKGEAVELSALLQSDKPVFVDFVFATCTTICPVLSAGYSNLQRKLGNESDHVRLISISIDPEHDGPEEMTAYLNRYRAQAGWDFLTGTREDIDSVLRAFDAFIPDKMAHRPLTFIRSPKDGRWVQLDGFAGSSELLEEFRRASKGPSPEEVR